MLTHLTPTTPAASVIGEVHRVLNAGLDQPTHAVIGLRPC